MSTQIRLMTESEVQLLVNWAADEGWNPGLRDAQAFWQLDPQGFLGIETDGELAGGGAVIRHNDQFGFMGLFIIRPEFRGHRLGTELWTARRDHLLSRLSPGATIGLDGVDAMVPFYGRGGFKAFTRHRRFELTESTLDESEQDTVVDLRSVNFDLIALLDEECFPGDRRAFLHSWINQPDVVSLGDGNGTRLNGFGVMRPCQSGWKVGPLFADEFSAADRLLRAFRRRAAGRPVYLDVPDNNPKALRLCHDHRMMEVFGCVRMYLGPVPDLTHDRIYGITTLEAG